MGKWWIWKNIQTTALIESYEAVAFIGLKDNINYDIEIEEMVENENSHLEEC